MGHKYTQIGVGYDAHIVCEHCMLPIGTAKDVACFPLSTAYVRSKLKEGVSKEELIRDERFAPTVLQKLRLKSSKPVPAEPIPFLYWVCMRELKYIALGPTPDYR